MTTEAEAEEQKKKLRDGLARSLFVRKVSLNFRKGDEEKKEPAASAFAAPENLSPELAGLDDVEKTLQILSTAAPSTSEAVGPARAPDAREAWAHHLRMRLVKEFSKSAEADKIRKVTESEAERAARPYLQKALERSLDEERVSMTTAQRAETVQAMLDEVVGYGPITPLLRDPEITEVMVNGPWIVFVEKRGRLERSQVRFHDDDHLMGVISRIANRIGRQIDLANPTVDARLPDGSRVHAIIPPLSLDGAALTIRKFKTHTLQMEDMLQFGALTPDMAYFLGACVKARINILVAGGTGTGKTTLLNVLSTLVQPGQRLVTIEDSAELKVKESHPHVVRLETRAATSSSGGRGAVSIRDLVRSSLRMRPDRVIVGECRGGEALDMLQAMNTGHDGSMTTAHANSAKETLQRIETMCLMAGVDLPASAIRGQIASAIELVAHLKRYPDGSRKVAEIAEVAGIENGEIALRPLFWFEQTGRDEANKVTGAFHVADGPPRFIHKFEAEGIAFPREIFGGGTSVTGEELRAPVESAKPVEAGDSSARVYQAFAVDLNQIGFAAAWTMGVFSALGFPSERIPETELAMAEAIGNIARHAYPSDERGVMEIEVATDDESFFVTLVDTGSPFDPTAADPVERQGDEEHGMGISLMRTIADDLAYEFRDGRNRFTLKFLRRKPAAL